MRSEDARVYAAQAGGHVLDPVTGVHDNVWVFDFKSLYPSLIRTFNIDPLAYVAKPAPDADLIETVSGAHFTREPAILPQLLDDLFPRREAAKRSGDSVASHAIKILMNSFYGVLGTPACRFYNPALSECDHRTGQTFPVVVEALVRSGGIQGAVRRYRQPVRTIWQRRPGRGRARRRGACASG